MHCLYIASCVRVCVYVHALVPAVMGFVDMRYPCGCVCMCKLLSVCVCVCVCKLLCVCVCVCKSLISLVGICMFLY